MVFLIELTHNRAKIFRIEFVSRLLMAITIMAIAYLTFKSLLGVFLGLFSK